MFILLLLLMPTLLIYCFLTKRLRVIQVCHQQQIHVGYLASILHIFLLYKESRKVALRRLLRLFACCLFLYFTSNNSQIIYVTGGLHKNTSEQHFFSIELTERRIYNGTGERCLSNQVLAKVGLIKYRCTQSSLETAGAPLLYFLG